MSAPANHLSVRKPEKERKNTGKHNKSSREKHWQNAGKILLIDLMRTV
jgi:hypothetical protein